MNHYLPLFAQTSHIASILYSMHFCTMTLIREEEQCGTKPEKLGPFQDSIHVEAIDFENDKLAVEQKRSLAGK